MPDVTHSIDLLARKPATIRFHSLQEDGTLTIFVIRTGEESRELLSITFRTFTNYLITRYDHSKGARDAIRIARRTKFGWFRTVGYRHMISTEDRLFEVTSEEKPQCSIVWQQQTTVPEAKTEPRASTWQELLEILESVLENDDCPA